MTRSLGLLFATVGILGAQQVPPAAPPDDDVTAYLKVQRAPALQKMAADDLIKAGNMALADKEYDNAAEDFRKAMAADPANTGGMIGVAHVYQAQGQTADAIRFLQSEFANEPTKVLFALVNFAVEAGELNAALDALHHAPAAMRTTSLYQQMAAIYRFQGDRDSAVDAMRKAQEASPRDTRVALELANDLLAAGYAEEAGRLYRAQLGADPNDGPALLKRCTELANSADASLALECAQRASSLMPDDLDASELLAWSYIHRGLPGQAVPIYAKLVEKAPQEYLYHERFAMAIRQSGKSSAESADQQRHELETALQCNPPGEARQTIELMLKNLGTPQKRE